MTYKVTSAHEEGGERLYAVSTQRFLGSDGKVSAIELTEVAWVDGKLTVQEGSEITLTADLVLLAMGFTGPEKTPLLTQLHLEVDGRGVVTRNRDYSTANPGVFVCGDAGRGQSLIVWAIAEGRSAAASIDAFLNQTSKSELPTPIFANAKQLLV
jgi:glutamate synthase (NADPH/NADH) small chain